MLRARKDTHRTTSKHRSLHEEDQPSSPPFRSFKSMLRSARQSNFSFRFYGLAKLIYWSIRINWYRHMPVYNGVCDMFIVLSQNQIHWVPLTCKILKHKRINKNIVSYGYDTIRWENGKLCVEKISSIDFMCNLYISFLTVIQRFFLTRSSQFLERKKKLNQTRFMAFAILFTIIIITMVE